MSVFLFLFVLLTTSAANKDQPNGYLNAACLFQKTSDLNQVLLSLTNQEVDTDESSLCHRSPFKKYQTEDVVKCLDSLSIERNRRPMHIAFIGDSTVRQHFLSFLRLIPDNDWIVSSRSSKFAEYYFHEDRNMTSKLFDNLLVSFYWRNLIRSDLIADFQRWATSDTAPDIILIGLTAHHIRSNEVTQNLEEFQELFKKDLLPLMEQSLAIHPQQEIIWLLQSPTNPYLSLHFLNVKIAGFSTNSIIPRYNRSVRRIFKGSKVKIWDSTNIVVTEYLRACALTRVQRTDSTRYFNCDDLIHPGFGALSIGTQLFVNHICSSVV